MAKKIGDYSIGIKYEIDQNSLNSLQESLIKIQAMGQLAKPGKAMTEELQQAGKTAEQVGHILEQSFNKDLGTVNITKFNGLLRQSNLSIDTIAKHFSQAGNAGTVAFSKLT